VEFSEGWSHDKHAGMNWRRVKRTCNVWLVVRTPARLRLWVSQHKMREMDASCYSTNRELIGFIFGDFAYSNGVVCLNLMHLWWSYISFGSE
jgi:hypothetical protein